MQRTEAAVETMEGGAVPEMPGEPVPTAFAPGESVLHKSFPPEAAGAGLDAFLNARLTIRELQTPMLTLDRGALAENTRIMFDWLRERGLSIAPHGKTTMSPPLWSQVLDAGAWGLTLATGWQAQVARSVGVRRIMIANTLVDPVAVRWAVGELDRNDDLDLISWVDGEETVRLMAEQVRASGARRRFPVIVELGGAGGRTGVRGVDAALRLARSIQATGVLEIAGVGGYEGALAHDRRPESIARVDGYLDEIARLHAAVRDDGLYRPARPIVTAGGSAYFDRVDARLGRLHDEAIVLLRSGAFQVHDDGFYAATGPMGTITGERPFRSAMHAFVRVISRPEPDLVLFDAGKRDLPFDEGMPVAQRVLGSTRADDERLLADSTVTALNDQHGFLRLAAGDPDALPVGTVLRLGLSHPCTAFDKWRLIPVIDDADSDLPVVVDAVETRF